MSTATISKPTARRTLGLLPSPDQIPALYQSAGLKPWRHEWRAFDGGRLIGCTAIVMAYHATEDVSAERVGRLGSGLFIMLKVTLKVQAGVIHGAVAGFSGMKPQYALGRELPGFWAGYEWGQAAWQACVDAGLTEELQEVDTETA